ncbi:MAG TPA: phospho-N-acetylmuramoyl-pentapeptide-transferase [Candidatus Krumholzibacteria bacterium]|nr:phospho-N-acetylmuramoyl-pentapeptide-transferase [Candidatus Krumholzibacteria bacterium]HPD72401.1 phospho-N-acetylmuramoyl-pentapeptide-transferase [Candidatus Krumholzibacteria bacterium]HRY40667.1 phospho-N-acetylmuramoyl-pentapeptide-transferase [Candidatus Krumholzibacteria bacterium]
MLYELMHALERIGGPAVFRYVTTRAALAFICGFVVVLAVGRPLINWLYRHGIRSFERTYGDINTTAKTGTPIMGGLLMALGGLGAALLWCDLTNPFVWVLFASAIYFAGFGILDDWLKIRHRDPDRGLSRPLKLASQALFGLALGLYLAWPEISPFPERVGTQIQIPFLKGARLDLGYWILAWSAFYIAYHVNAVNITDGMDGLATVPAILVFSVIAVFAYIAGNVQLSGHYIYAFIPRSSEITVFCAAIIGAGLGFLWYVCHPASVFLGDTGSLFIGGVLGTAALMIRQELVCLFAGLIFLLELLSTFVQEQVGFKLLQRRLLPRAPLHHVFQHRGMAESKIVVRFWIVSLICAAGSLLTIKFR